MVAERDSVVSDRYGTFKEDERGKSELSYVVDEERWRIQKSCQWIGRVKVFLGVASAVFIVSAMILARQSPAQQASDRTDVAKSDAVPAAVSTLTTGAVSLQSVRVYRAADGAVEIEFGDDKVTAPADAWGTFNDSLEAIGWSQLWIKTANLTKEEYDDEPVARRRRAEIMYAAGYAEGVLTHHRIDQHFNNVYLTFFPSGDESDKKTVQALHKFFAKNLDWMQKQIRYHDEDPDLPDAPYWKAMASILAQFDGLVAGYHYATQSKSPASRLDLFMLNADGDLEDLVTVVKRTPTYKNDEGEDRDAVEASNDFYTFIKNLKCSALIRILPNSSDLVWGHATWDTFASMNRIFKHYDVPLPGGSNHKTAVKRRISMSSSPGFLSSVDDWYMTSAGLGVMETTHGVFDPALYNLVTPESVPCWLRSKIANFVATDGPSWAATFAKHNSGTYNNQWMIIDTNKFVRGTGFTENGLTVLEQLPGFVHVEDVSSVVNTQGYWGSYNVPYFPSIYERSGFARKYEATNHSAPWSHERCARAQIFRRDARTIESFADFKRVIRSNKWRDDPLSEGHASHAIASRYDLETDPTYFSLDGAIDAKVTSLDKLQRLECDAQAGPTHDTNPVFEWTPELSKLAPHVGQPQRFDFDFHTMQHE